MSPGPDKFNPRVIIEVSETLLESLLIIFNYSLKNESQKIGKRQILLQYIKEGISLILAITEQ